MRTLKKITLALAATALAAAVGASPAFAEKTMRLSHLNPDNPFDSASGAMAAVFKNLVETGTNGSVKVQLFANGQLGKDNEVIQQVRDGIVESAISSSGGVAQHYKMVGVFDLPFAFPNITVANRVIDINSDFGKKLTADINAKTGLKTLGLLDSGGYFEISNSKRPIKTLADMQGLRIRTMTLPTHEAIIKSLGGVPTALPWAEVYTALQTGVADGQMNPVPIIAFAKFDEVQKYLSITNHVLTPYFWFINAKFYASLTPEERKVVDQAAETAVEAGRGISRIIEASTEKGLPKLGKKMQINTIPAAEIHKFAAASQPAVRKIIEEQLGADGVAMLNSMLAEIKKASN
ncbi:MAG: DctP family TRAP transporter solute-binding subunit [Burkholderiaceae bacterium]|nr:DctP family TRAP transporter solute-binding subunit [Burkholderiaceae bacterium]